MIKTLLIGVQLFLVSFFQWLSLSVDDVTVVQKIPAEVKAGDEFVVEISLIKGDLSGLAKLQQDLPKGFVATAMSNAEGTFSFKDNSVKFIWMALPADQTVTVSYKIRVEETVPGGEVFLGGRFSYVKDNERKVAVIPVKKLVVKSDHVQTTSTGDSSGSGDDTSGTGGTEEAASATQVEAHRSVSGADVTPSGEFTVTIQVKKNDLSGYAKIQETIPKGYSASGIETQGAIFSFVGQDVKFLWMNLPAGDEFIISYKVKAPATINPDDRIEGAFTFMEKEESKKYLIDPTPLQGGDIIAMGTGDENKSEEDTGTVDIPEDVADEGTDDTGKVEEIAAVPPPPPEKKEEDKTDEGKKEETQPIIPAPQNGVFYRVQIMALQKRAIDVSYFQKNKNISEQVMAEQHEGWNKYTVGKLSVYREARDKREAIRNQNNVEGPFVTAYNGGARITVQEALMITKQQWYK